MTSMSLLPSLGLPFLAEALILILLFIIGLVIIIVIAKVILFFLPAAIIAVIVYFLTSSLTWAGVAFLVICVISLVRRK